MSVSSLSADIRTEFGKGAARRTRREGKVPAVLYGHGEEPKHLALPSLAFATAIRYGGMTQVITLKISDGSKVMVLPKAIQRDPIKNTYEHADLLLVRRGEKVTVDVPVQVVGEPARGTLVMHEHDRISINADATKLPDHVEASVEGLDVGARVTAADIALPAGAELATDPDTVMVMVSASPTAAQMEAEGSGEAPAEAVEPEPAAEAASAGEATSGS